MIVHNPDSTCRTGLFTDSTANTAYLTLFFCLSSFAFVRTFDYNIIGTFMDMDNFLRTDFHTFSTGKAFIFIDFRHTIFIQGNCAKFTYADASSTANATICTSFFSLYRPASTITCYKGGSVWKSFFAAISTLPFVWCICKRQIISANSIITEICICNCRCSRNGCDLPNADGTACNLQSWLIYNDCFYFGNFM